LSESQKDLVKRTVAYCIDGGLNDFLYHLDVEIRKKKYIQILVDGKDCSTLTEALYRELYGPDGWKEKYSKYEADTT